MAGFAHLHVASGFSMRYGASMPEHLVERAAEHGQGALALTDRDGLYGADLRFRHGVRPRRHRTGARRRPRRRAARAGPGARQ